MLSQPFCRRFSWIGSLHITDAPKYFCKHGSHLDRHPHGYQCALWCSVQLDCQLTHMISLEQMSPALIRLCPSRSHDGSCCAELLARRESPRKRIC